MSTSTPGAAPRLSAVLVESVPDGAGGSMLDAKERFYLDEPEFQGAWILSAVPQVPVSIDVEWSLLSGAGVADGLAPGHAPVQAPVQAPVLLSHHTLEVPAGDPEKVRGRFFVRRPEVGWTRGHYQVQLRLGGEVQATLPFQVTSREDISGALLEACTCAHPAAEGQPPVPVETFSPAAEAVHVQWWYFERLPPETVVGCRWIAVDVGDVAPPRSIIASAQLRLGDTLPEGGGSGRFRLSRPTAGWPVGHYAAELSVNGHPSRVVEWRVLP